MAPFTKADVEYLLAERKFIRAVPRAPVVTDSGRSPFQAISASVFRKSDPGRPIDGLRIVAKVSISPPGLPRSSPSSALVWHGIRIRGLDREIWHDNPDGSIVQGWHEHLWSPQDRDRYVVIARPEPKQKGLTDVFKWGLEKWKIEVVEQQLEVFNGKSD